MSIQVIKYCPDKRVAWDNFVKNSNNGTIFHLQEFIDYHPNEKFNFFHLMFYKNNDLIAILPGGLTKEKCFWSPVGASYGSFVTKDIHFATALELVDSLIGYAKDFGLKELYLIPPPIIYNVNYNQHIEYSLLYRNFDFELHYISHAIDLKNGKDFLTFFDKTARKNIHKILRENKLSIKDSDDYSSFHRILSENKERHGVKPTHSLDEMLKLKDLIPDKLKLMLVYYEGKPIAGTWLFICNQKVLLCFYNMLLYEYEHLKPIYLVMYETVRWAVENGFEWVDIGVSQDTKSENPMTPSLDLIRFKERFDSRGVLRTTYHFKIND